MFQEGKNSDGVITVTVSNESVTAEKITLNFVEQRVFDVGSLDSAHQRALDCFLNHRSENAWFGRYHVLGDTLYYKAVVTENHVGRSDLAFREMLREMIRTNSAQLLAGDLNNPNSSIKYAVCKADVVAIRLPSGDYVGNASELSLIGRRVAFGREVRRGGNGVADVQQVMGNLIPMVPFNVFKEAELNIADLTILERGPEETLTIKEQRWNSTTRENESVDVERHYTGASLYRLGDTFYLFDIDRREIEHGILNPFMVQLARPCSSIADAYASLIPQAVLDAQAKGLDVKRQGEWFFVASPESDGIEPTKNAKLSDRNGVSSFNSWDGIELRAGRNRPNYAQTGNEQHSLVRGLVLHSGREHAPLNLGQGVWYRAIPNTSVQSFTITGRID